MKILLVVLCLLLMTERAYSTDSLMVQVVGGTFTAGTTLVTISSFKMDKFEVTYELWTSVRNWALTHGYTDLVAGQNGSSPVGANNPVTWVNWYDVVKWCNARSEKDGLTPVYYTTSAQNVVYKTGETVINIDAVKWTASGYRLPTEAEWEFAARGGVLAQSAPYMYSGSDTINNVAWYVANSGITTHPVGQKSANALGIYDMSGNVQEWCWDWWDNTGDYPSGTTDPKGPATTQSARLLRGGSFGHSEFYSQVNLRNSGLPSGRDRYCGFRSVQDSLVGTAVEAESSIPTGFELCQNFPNPFNPSTTIRFGLPNRTRVLLSVFNSLGQQVAMLVDGEMNAGYHEAIFDATGLASGVYLYRLQAGESVETRKLILLR
jgi:formylglycine-generating enzyme required for sulfatase activity